MMRALIMISSIAMGGAERNIVSVLPYLEAEGLDVRLCSMNTRHDSSLAEDFTRSGVERLDLGAKRMLDLAAWKRFVSLLREKKIDIVHSQDQDTNIYAALAHWRLRMPAVMSRHVMVEPVDTFKESMRARLVLVAAHRGFDRIITVSEAVRKHFAKQANIPLSKIETIYNGIDMERFATQDRREAKRAEMGWAQNDRVIIMVAVLRRGKGHEVLFEAIPRLSETVPNVKIKLVGDGELADSLREQAAPFGDIVEFLGQRTDVPELLGASDMLVLPSWSEALPTVLIEAGGASLPLVATDVGGAAEIVEEANTGYLVQPGDATQLTYRLISLLQDPVQARQMGQRAHERVVNLFSLARQAQETIALYERILSER